MIITVKLRAAVFWLLIFAAAACAALFLIFSDRSEAASIFTAGKPAELVLVIDAGHGGEDGGAVSISGVPESRINLDISQRMAALSGLTGIEYVMTRDSEDIEYPEKANSVSKRKKYDQEKRVELINGTANAVLISIHQNCYPHKSPHGPQSFYSKYDGSDELAVLIQDSMNSSLCPGNRRMAMPVAGNIYLYKNVNCPAVLVECGFISNPGESKLLDTESYRLKIAAVLICAYLQYVDTNE